MEENEIYYLISDIFSKSKSEAIKSNYNLDVTEDNGYFCVVIDFDDNMLCSCDFKVHSNISKNDVTTKTKKLVKLLERMEKINRDYSEVYNGIKQLTEFDFLCR